MHPNRHFRRTDNTRNIAFVRERAFGVLAVNGESTPLTAHVPALLSENGEQIEFHLVKSNPIVKSLEQSAAAVWLFNGPDGYISPDWYSAVDQVPTWNYVAVRMEGAARRLPQDDLLPLLDRLSAHFESRLLPKPAWLSSKVSQQAMNSMLRAIVPFTFAVENIESTWKLNQNKPDEARLAAAGFVESCEIGSSTATLANYMRRAKSDL